MNSTSTSMWSPRLSAGGSVVYGNAPAPGMIGRCLKTDQKRDAE